MSQQDHQGAGGPGSARAATRSLRARLPTAARVAGVLVVASGLGAIAGWLLGIERLTSPVAGWPPQVANSGVMMVFAGASLALLAHAPVPRWASWAGRLCAAAAGVVVGLETSELGGISLYERDLDGRTIYFYAHLRGYSPGLKVGDLVRQGDVLGFVGETGNVVSRHVSQSEDPANLPAWFGSGPDARPAHRAHHHLPHHP